MGGVLTHIGAGIITGIIIHLFHFKWEFSLAGFLGNLFPDVIRNGLTAAKQGTWNVIMVNFSDPFYRILSTWTNDPTNWLLAGTTMAALVGFAYHFHYIKKKSFREYGELIAFLVLGILMHLIIDATIIETSVWI